MMMQFHEKKVKQKIKHFMKIAGVGFDTLDIYYMSTKYLTLIKLIKKIRRKM